MGKFAVLVHPPSVAVNVKVVVPTLPSVAVLAMANGPKGTLPPDNPDMEEPLFAAVQLMFAPSVLTKDNCGTVAPEQ